jgi:YegS/Rv2252/BmrU family lipid kinase
VTTRIIVNPQAGRGRGPQLLEQALAEKGFDAEIVLTSRAGHGVDLAAQARRDGIDMVVAAGGDGTVHEVVNGLLQESVAPMPVLGLVPLGSGCDYAKTFDVPHDIGAAVELLAAEKPTIEVDAGSIEYREGSRFFANIAEVGIGPECVARAIRLPRFLGPAIYGIAFVITLPLFKRREANIGMDASSYDGQMTNLVVAIGRVFGGGMRVAPKADPADGAFDVQVQTGSKLDYVRGLPKVYNGTHVPHPMIREERAARVTVECDPAGLIEADGEVLGHTPATFTVLPGALRLKA